MTSFTLHGFIVEMARLSLWFVILAAIFVPLERVFALREQKVVRPMLAEDIFYFYFNGIIATAILSIPVAGIVAASCFVVPDSYYAMIDALPVWVRFLGVFLIGEFGFYWGHRWSHEIGILWRFHAIHHQPTQLDWLVNTRAHPVDIIFTRLCGLIPVYALGFGSTKSAAGTLGPILLVLAGTVWSFFIHANLRWRLGWFEHMLSSPRFHHWHHAKVGPINRNYAPMLPVLDRMFGTLHLPARGWPEQYGIMSSNAPPAPVPPEPETERSLRA